MLIEVFAILFFLSFAFVLARVCRVGQFRAGTKRLIATFWALTLMIFIAVAFGSRELRMLPIVYLNDQNRWIPREAAFIQPPDVNSEFSTGLWNRTCIHCHATHGEPRITNIQRDFEGSYFDSHVAEFGIACEACHGPGEEHAKLNRDPKRRYDLHFTDKPDSSIVNPSRLLHVRSAQVCGQCHGVKTYFSEKHFFDLHFAGSSYKPGNDLNEHHNIFCNAGLNHPSIQDALKWDPDFKVNSFWDDGMVRVSGREYNGLIESPCFLRGTMSCVSCHAMHKADSDDRASTDWANDQLAVNMESNHACVQCHTEFAKEQKLTSHTHHLPESSGSSCYNCHMPRTTYELLKSIRSHEIDVPRVSDSLDVGRPNACNLCHMDRSLGWTAQALHKWYGQDVPAMTAEQQDVAATVLWTLRGDAGLRALMAASMEWSSAKDVSGTDWLVPYLTELMNDSYYAVRLIAYRAIRKLPGLQNVEFDEFAQQPQRDEAIQRILERWGNVSPVSNGRTKSTLYDSDGRLMTDRFQKIREQRDETRRVFLAE